MKNHLAEEGTDDRSFLDKPTGLGSSPQACQLGGQPSPMGLPGSVPRGTSVEGKRAKLDQTWIRTAITFCVTLSN